MNRNTLNNFLFFTAGAVIGSVVTWKLIKTKYEQLAQEEIDSVKAAYCPHEDEPESETPDNNIEKGYVPNATDLNSYAETLAAQGYTDYANAKNGIVNTTKPAEEVDDVERPYVISYEDFGELDNYNIVSLIYFNDGVLTDSQYEPVEDADSIVGLESLEHFGDEEDDSVFVRNDKRKTDYEILKDERNYADLLDPEELE
jgi:hypothetical protein